MLKTLGGIFLIALLRLFSCNSPAPTPEAPKLSYTFTWKYDCKTWGTPDYFEYGTYQNLTFFPIDTLKVSSCADVQTFSVSNKLQNVTTSTVFYVRAHLKDGFSDDETTMISGSPSK